MLPFSNPGLARGDLLPCDSRAGTLSDFPRTRPAPPPEARSGGFGALLKYRELGSPRPATRPSRCRDMPKPPTSRRTREEVDATLQVAKLNTAELLPTVHCLSFGPGTSGAAAGDFCLLELEPALCQQLEAGHSFVIRGDKDEQAVLCSQDKTYDLKIADTSNMLLVIPGCKTPDQLKREEAQSNIVHNEVWLCPMRMFEKAVRVLSLPLLKTFGVRYGLS